MHSLRSNLGSRSARRPSHVAIIMDGNGRWALARGLPRFEGHRRGVEAVRRAVRSAIEHEVQFLTIYSFSSENWSRPPEEVAMLMGLLKRFIRNDLAELNAHGVRVRVIGERDNLTPDIVALHRRGRGADGEQPRAHPDGRVQLRGASRDRRGGAAHGDRRSRRASRCAGDRSETNWPSGSIPPAFPIRTSSSARPAKCACRISCSGRRPTPNSCSCRSCGLISTMRLSSPRSINMRRASGGLARLVEPAAVKSAS